MTTPQAETEAQAPYLPTYGDIEWPVLIAAVRDAVGARPTIDPKFYIGHQSPGINFNSLNRIVSGFVRAALTPKPLSVALEDEALIEGVKNAIHYSWRNSGYTPEAVIQGVIDRADEALRRRIAELRADIDTANRELNRALARVHELADANETAESALAACRDKTIEECAEVAAKQYRGVSYDANSMGETIARRIRALKEHKHG